MFDFRLIVESIPFLLKGAVYTVQVSILAIAVGLVLGWLFGVAAVSGVTVLRVVTFGYVQFIRGTPLLVQIFLIYFGLPALGINVPAYWSGVIALGLNSGGSRRRSCAPASSRSTAGNRRPLDPSGCRGSRR